MPLRPDIGDVIELVDDPDQHDEASTANARPEPSPSLAEQRARRRYRGGLARDVRRGVA